MELKKAPKHDLSRKSGLFLNIGLTLSLLMVILAFEWPDKGNEKIMDLGQVIDDFDEILEIPPTDIQPPPPPPKIQVPEINEVEDDTEIEEELEDLTLDTETHEDMIVEDIEFVEAPPEEPVDKVFIVVENDPEFPGGLEAFYSYIGKKMRYPSQARRMGVEGRVFVEFIVDKDGSLTDIKAVKGIGAGCDEEALRVMKTVPKFKPGRQRGTPVKVKMTFPIYFKLAK